MFDLNPLAQANAWWQHLIMLLGAGVIGYFIGYRKSLGLAAQLEGELQDVEKNLDDCRNTVTVDATEWTAPVQMAPGVSMPVMAATPVAEVVAPVTPDNLKKIEGIGPKIEQLLHQGGILTFRQLSQASPATIQEILRAGGPRFQMHDPGSWPQQAALAADEKWDELTTLQSELNKGRVV